MVSVVFGSSGIKGGDNPPGWAGYMGRANQIRGFDYLPTTILDIRGVAGGAGGGHYKS
jgi:hypothetical protein